MSQVQARIRRRSISLAALLITGSAALAEGPRSPSDLLIDEARGWLFTANEGSGSVSALDLKTGEVLAELELDPRGRPRAMAAAPRIGGRLLIAVSERFLHRVALVEVQDGLAASGPPRPSLRLLGRLAAGRLPGGVLFHGSPARLLVASSGEGTVWEIEPERGEVLRKMPAVEGAKLLALAGPPGQEMLIVTGRSEAAGLSLADGRVRWRYAPADGQALNLNGLAVLGDRAFIAHQVAPAGGVTGPTMIVWGLTIANRVTALSLPRLNESGEGKAPTGPLSFTVALDTLGRGAGDPGSPAVIAPAAAGEPARLLVPSAGTRRLLLIDGLEEPDPPFEFLTRPSALPQIATGARPVAARAAPGGGKVYVVCSLDDTIQEVDPKEQRVLRTIRLGPPPSPTPAHLGARIYFDAERSLGGWYSCQSCHPDGGTEGHQFDTPADGNGGPKRTPGLVGIERSGPWAWLGKFGTLREQLESSLENTMATSRPPAGEDVDRLLAYIRTLEAPLPVAPDEDLGGDPDRGAQVFQAAACGSCHQPPEYTSGGTHDVGFADRSNGNRRFNAPSLLGARDRFRFLHDGRAATLSEVFRAPDAPGPHGEVQLLGETAVTDLVAFLKTLGSAPPARTAEGAAR